MFNPWFNHIHCGGILGSTLVKEIIRQMIIEGCDEVGL